MFELLSPDFAKRQESGLARIALADDKDKRYVVYSANFDSYTGERMDDVVTAVTLTNLQAQRADLQAQLDALDAVIASLDGLKAEAVADDVAVALGLKAD